MSWGLCWSRCAVTSKILSGIQESVEILSASSDLLSETSDETTDDENAREDAETVTMCQNGNILETFAGLSVCCTDKSLGIGPHGEVKEGIIHLSPGYGKKRKEVVVKFNSLTNNHTWGLPNGRIRFSGLPEHENVATVYGYGMFLPRIDQDLDLGNHDLETSPKSFIVIDKLPRNLNHLLFEDNSFAQKITFHDILDISIGITQGLRHLHEHKIPHCNLKPSNVLIGRDCSKIVPKVADYGLVKINSGKDSQRVEWSTQGSIAPEVRLWDEDNVENYHCNTTGSVIAGMDVYSLGTVMYQMVSRCLNLDQYATVEESQEDASIQMITVQGPVRLVCSAPDDLRALIEECLQFSFDKVEEGEKEFGRPTLDNILHRLSLMKRKEWAGNRVREYVKVLHLDYGIYRCSLNY